MIVLRVKISTMLQNFTTADRIPYLW